MLAASGAAFSQQITCPVVSDTTLWSNGVNTVSPCAVNATATLTNNAVFTNELGGDLDVEGAFENNGTVVNRIAGTILINGTLDNNSGGFITSDSSSTITNNSFLNNRAGATLSNFGVLNGTGTIVNLGTLDNFGILTNVVFNSGGTIANGGGTLLFGSGSDILGGTLNNALVSGTLGISGPGTTATLDGSTGFGAVTIQGTYTSDLGTTTQIVGVLNNQGNIQVNSGGGLDTHLTLIGDTTLQGGGTVTLASIGGGTSFIDGAHILTNVDNTIQGAGTIGDGTFGFPTLVNGTAGTINANATGQTLFIQGVFMSNAGLMEATNGGGLDFTEGILANSGGAVVADGGGSLLQLNASTVTGGTITASNGGQIGINGGTMVTGGTITAVSGGTVTLSAADIIGGALNNASGTIQGSGVTLDGSTAAGAVTIQGAYTATGDTDVLGVINNQGAITQAGSGHLFLSGDTTLQGGGTLTLGGGALGGAHVLDNVNNTIQGWGQIGTSGLGFPTLINEAGGTINANASGQTLFIQNVFMTNAGLMAATNGGGLDFTEGILANSGGAVVADGGGSLLQINASTVTGGTIAALNGGQVGLNGATNIQGGILRNINGTLGTTTGSSATLDGSTGFGAVTIQGTYTSDAGSVTNVVGTINNQGNIQVNGGTFSTHLTLTGNTTLQGGGIVTLSNLGFGNSFIDAATTGLTLTNVDNAIHGAGTITGVGTGMQILNLSGGTILADAPGQILAINGAILTNAGTVQVNAGSTLQVIAPFTQTGGRTQVDGTMLAAVGENVSGGSVLGNGTINGNVTMTGGTMQPGGLTIPGTLTINGNYSQTNATFNELIGGATANGLLVVNGTSTLGSGALLNIDLLGGFTPAAGETFTLMDYFGNSGEFANALSGTEFAMDGWEWTIDYSFGGDSIVLDAVSPVSGGGGGGTATPEPSSLLLILAALSIGSAWSLIRRTSLILGN